MIAILSAHVLLAAPCGLKSCHEYRNHHRYFPSGCQFRDLGWRGVGGVAPKSDQLSVNLEVDGRKFKRVQLRLGLDGDAPSFGLALTRKLALRPLHLLHGLHAARQALQLPRSG